MGIFVELVYICISQYVFKSRKDCNLSRELVSFFPPPNLPLEKANCLETDSYHSAKEGG